MRRGFMCVPGEVCWLLLLLFFSSSVTPLGGGKVSVSLYTLGMN